MAQRCGFWTCLLGMVVTIGASRAAFGELPSLRLGARYTVGEEQVELSNAADAGRFKLPCDVTIPTLTAQCDAAIYRPAWDGYAGLTEVLVRRWKTPEQLDDAVSVEVHHRGKVDVIKVDANAERDEWFSLGRFDFAGSPEEFVRIVRTRDKDAAITPALGVRFDVYYDTKPRAWTDGERAATAPPGFSTTGKWSDSNDAKTSNSVGATAIWSPQLVEPGTYGVYIFKPNVEAGDVFEIWHSGQVDHVDLRAVRQSNFELGNPRVQQGWYKIGEFEFNGEGVEGLRVVKARDGVETRAGTAYFEKALLDGTILHRTLVPATAAPPAAAQEQAASMSLQQKIERSRLAPGFSPQTPADASSKLGATVYARPLVLKSNTTPYRWNPCLTVPGDYEVSYYSYWPLKADGAFSVHHAGQVEQRPLAKTQATQGAFASLGTFRFAGDGTDEFLEMTGIDRASEVVFERSVAGGRIRRQTWVTVHPYFREIRYTDTNGLENAHDISFMVQKGVMAPMAEDRFEPELLMSIDAFVKALQKTIGMRSGRGAADVADLTKQYGWNLDKPILGYQASVLCEDALACDGRYSNVSNFGVVDLAEALKDAPELNDVPAIHRFALARLAALEITPLTRATRGALMRPVTRGEAASLLKNFFEQGLSAGPPLDADWEMSFHDEFNVDQIDWSKWKPRHGVRFKGYSAIWAENCSVRDGMLVLSNYMDNKVVPYSTASLTAREGQVYGFFEARHNYPNQAYGSHTSFWFSTQVVGDFNVNEGTYPNHISNNNYFMTPKEVPELKKGSANFNNFTIDTNFAHDLHTISGYLDENNLFYALDGQITYAVKDYPKYYADKSKTTNYPYAPIISSVITFFDGPLDRDRIDGSCVLVDWVRSYRKATSMPKVVEAIRVVDNEGRTVGAQLRFNKRMRIASLAADSCSISSGGHVIKGVASKRYRR